MSNNDFYVVTHELYVDETNAVEVAKELRRGDYSRRQVKQTPLQALTAGACMACPSLLGVWVKGNEPVCEFVEAGPRTARMVNVNPSCTEVFDSLDGANPGSYVVVRNRNWEVETWRWRFSGHSYDRYTEEQKIITPGLDTWRTYVYQRKVSVKNDIDMDVPIEIAIAYCGTVTEWMRLEAGEKKTVTVKGGRVGAPLDFHEPYYYAQTIPRPGEKTYFWGAKSSVTNTFALLNGETEGFRRLGPREDKIAVTLNKEKLEALRKIRAEAAYRAKVEAEAEAHRSRYRQPVGKRGRAARHTPCRYCAVEKQLHGEFCDVTAVVERALLVEAAE